MSLTKANHHNQHSHPSRMPLTKANHYNQPSHLCRMPLVEANHHNQSNIPCMIHYSPQHSNRSFILNSFWRIYSMLEEGGNHLPVPLVECPRQVEGSIPVIPGHIKRLLISIFTFGNHITHHHMMWTLTKLNGIREPKIYLTQVCWN